MLRSSRPMSRRTCNKESSADSSLRIGPCVAPTKLAEVRRLSTQPNQLNGAAGLSPSWIQAKLRKKDTLKNTLSIHACQPPWHHLSTQSAARSFPCAEDLEIQCACSSPKPSPLPAGRRWRLAAQRHRGQMAACKILKLVHNPLTPFLRYHEHRVMDRVVSLCIPRNLGSSSHSHDAQGTRAASRHKQTGRKKQLPLHSSTQRVQPVLPSHHMACLNMFG